MVAGRVHGALCFATLCRLSIDLAQRAAQVSNGPTLQEQFGACLAAAARNVPTRRLA